MHTSPFFLFYNLQSSKAVNDVFVNLSQVFDHNNDSYIDPDEIKRTMHFLGETVSDEEVRAMVMEADTDNDGLVDFEG